MNDLIKQLEARRADLQAEIDRLHDAIDILKGEWNPDRKAPEPPRLPPGPPGRAPRGWKEKAMVVLEAQFTGKRFGYSDVHPFLSGAAGQHVSRNTAQRLLTEMVNAGRMLRVKNGVYELTGADEGKAPVEALKAPRPVKCEECGSRDTEPVAQSMGNEWAFFWHCLGCAIAFYEPVIPPPYGEGARPSAKQLRALGFGVLKP